MTGHRLRPAEDGDLGRLREWRNHPQVRAVSLTRHEIGVAEHEAWWRAVRADPDRAVLVYLHGGRPAGVVTFAALASAPRALHWGFYLDIAGLTERDELLPAWLELERSAIAYAFGELGAESLGGETLAGNIAVLQLHRRFGFRVVRSYEQEIDGTPQRVVWTELSRSETRWRQ